MTTDKELQLKILRRFYEHREKNLTPIAEVYTGTDIPPKTFHRICEQLEKLDLVKLLHTHGSDAPESLVGLGKITVKGIAVIEGNTSTSSPRVVHTGGGPYIGGNVDTGGGSFTGRDQIEVGNIGQGSAVAVGRGAQASVASGLSGDEVAKLFETIYQRIEARPDTPAEDKADLKSEVQELQSEVAKGEQADEGFLTRRLRNIARIAPDILDVVVQTLGSSVKGIAEVVRKVLAKAKK